MPVLGDSVPFYLEADWKITVVRTEYQYITCTVAQNRHLEPITTFWRGFGTTVLVITTFWIFVVSCLSNPDGIYCFSHFKSLGFMASYPFGKPCRLSYPFGKYFDRPARSSPSGQCKLFDKEGIYTNTEVVRHTRVGLFSCPVVLRTTIDHPQRPSTVYRIIIS